MTRLTIIFFAILIALAQAQAQKSSANPAEYPLFLLTYQSVQRDLAVSPSFAKRLTLIQKDYEKRNWALISPIPSAPNTIRRPNPADVEANLKATDTAKLALLNEKQRARLKQIGLQYKGAIALSEDAMRRALQITPKQKEGMLKAWRQALKTYQASTAAIMKAATTGPKKGQSPTENMKKLASARLVMMKQLDASAAKILTAKQLAAWGQMKGKPFPVASLYAPVQSTAFSARS